MNCIQAQVMLAAHRELKNGEVDTTELDEHLEQCSSCRQVLARYSLIGEQVRLMPPLEPPPEMRIKLMRTLAAEHAQFIQRAAVPPPPEFLKPYLREHAHSSSKTDSLAAFSTADTGPLPIIRPTYKKRPRAHMSQFALIALAAVFVMTLMMSGITSLLLLAHDHIPNETTSISVNQFTSVVKATYATQTAYQHVVSAVADRTSIYYTAYGDGSHDGWMLEQLDRVTQISTPLLTTPSSTPLILLGSKDGWLVWLQFDPPQTTNIHPLHSPLRSWSLRYLSLTPHWQQRDIDVPNVPMTLISGTFDQDATPDWVRTPVQGIWFVQNTLLVAMIDENGVSHLMRYPLGAQSNLSATEIAKAGAEHILTSPTANSDGTQMYWAEEWRTDDGILHSNIWTQQVYDSSPSRGQMVPKTITVKQPFLQDGMSFRPVVVDETLFFLGTGTNGALATPSGTSVHAAAGTVVPVATPNMNPSATAWADTGIYEAPLDNEVRGNLFMFPLDSDPTTLPIQVNTGVGPVSSLQAGNRFVLWQTNDGYGMFDVATRMSISVEDVLNGAQFLAVNADTAVWTTESATDTGTNGASPLATLMAFNWPRK